MEKLVWHYAPWAYLAEIVEEGTLRCSNAGIGTTLPLLWFSANQQWEPTATKRLSTEKNGPSRPLSFKEQAVHLGCIRFGLAAEDARLMGWKVACDVAGILPKMRRAMEGDGRRQGANPAHWSASASAVPLGELFFQVWFKNAWYGVEGQGGLEAVAQKWTEARGGVIRTNPTAA
jgi:hypothetical protein